MLPGKKTSPNISHQTKFELISPGEYQSNKPVPVFAQVPRQVPREQCAQVPRQVVTQECRQVPRQVEHQECKQIPRQVSFVQLLRMRGALPRRR